MTTLTSRGNSKSISEKGSNIQDHLRNHAHLTNCIHLKNHIHMQKSKIMLDKRCSVETSLMKDLTILQRSQSLRDPSTSPSWNSPVIGSLMKKLENEGAFKKKDLGGVKPMGGDFRKGPRSPLTASPLSQSDTSRKIRGVVGGSSVKGSVEADRRQRRRRKLIGYGHADSRLRHMELKRNGRKKGSTHENWRSDSELGRKPKAKDLCRKDRLSRDAFRPQGRMEPNADLRTLPTRGINRDTKDKTSNSLDGKLKNRAAKDLKVHSPHFFQNNDCIRKDRILDEEAETGSPIDDKDCSTSHFDSHYQPNCPAGELDRSKKHKLKGIKRSQFYIHREAGEHCEPLSVSVALNSGSRGGINNKDFTDSQKTGLQAGTGKSTVIDIPKKGCGIPWNWSRIHDRGKSILDLAGRSLSCGLSDSSTRKIEGLASQGYSSSQREFSAALEISDHSISSLDSDSESLPLLLEPGGSQESADTDTQGGKLSGELDLYADHKIRLRQNIDVASETRLIGHFGHGQDNMGSGCLRAQDRSRSLPQKYVPKTFGELVGQNLAAQALMNAIVRGKIAPVYVFHGCQGTGKTSCARIFSAAMNCHSLDQSRPCGLCCSCLAQSLGKNSDVKEIGGIGSPAFESFQIALDNVVTYSPSSRYGVFIVDNCDTLASDDWNKFSKVLDEIPWNVVFIFTTSNLERLPHTILSRCQKFLFPKLKEIDIVNKLQAIALQEGLEIDNDALNLIASRSNGSMRDAEMTLDQLSLLGQRISLSLVQELVGMIPDEKLVDLLDLALSADTVNTVKSLRELIEAGVEPLGLMSQLATLITDILAGSYKLHRERHKRMFFHKQTLSKEEMNRLRQALRTLSEAEKQLLLSNDRTTWLTAAMLQLAPDTMRTFHNSSSGTSVIQSPVAHAREKENVDQETTGIKWNNLDKHSEPMQCAKGSPILETTVYSMKECSPHKISRESSSSHYFGRVTKSRPISVLAGNKISPSLDDSMDTMMTGDKDLPVYPSTYSDGLCKARRRQFICTSPNNAVQMESHANEHKTRPDDFGSSIPQALHSALDHQVEAQINSKKNILEVGVGFPADQSVSSNIIQNVANDSNQCRLQLCDSVTDAKISAVNGDKDGWRANDHKPFSSHNETSSTEIFGPELVRSSFHGYASSQEVVSRVHSDEERLESAWVQEAQSSPHIPMSGQSCPEMHRITREQAQAQAIGKSNVVHGCTNQQSEVNVGFDKNPKSNYTGGSSEHDSGGNSQANTLPVASPEGISIAERIEQENLRLESRSGGLLCWKTPKVDSGKAKHLKSRRRRQTFFQKLVPCAK